MVKQLLISRFKSIQSLTLPCRKVNLFIGAPDTGKTNILEALYFLCCLGWNLPIGQSLRLHQSTGFEPLFYHQFTDQPFIIRFDNFKMTTVLDHAQRSLISQGTMGEGRKYHISFDSCTHIADLAQFRYYKFESADAWKYDATVAPGAPVPFPPAGSNLLYLAKHNSRLNALFKETVSTQNRKLRFDADRKKFVLTEERHDEYVDYNLELLSDTVKRFFFYGSIILGSSNACLILDEPDVYAFPPYPKTLAEMVAADKTNQFFLTTHNPYFLAGIVEKTPAEHLALFVCDRDAKNDTSARMLTVPEVQEVIAQGADVFFNLDKFSGAPK